MSSRTTRRCTALACCVVVSLATPGCGLAKLPFQLAFGLTKTAVLLPVGILAGVTGLSAPSSPPEGRINHSPEALSAYEAGVSRFTEEYTRTASEDDFLLGLEAIARRHGIAPWEQAAETYRGIGAGLRAAGLAPQGFAQVQSAIAPAHPYALEWIEAGYAGQ